MPGTIIWTLRLIRSTSRSGRCPSGMISPRTAVLFSLLLNALALIIAAFINVGSFVIVLFFSLMLYIYSWKLKSTVLVAT